MSAASEILNMFNGDGVLDLLKVVSKDNFDFILFTLSACVDVPSPFLRDTDQAPLPRIKELVAFAFKLQQCRGPFRLPTTHDPDSKVVGAKNIGQNRHLTQKAGYIISYEPWVTASSPLWRAY